MPEPTLNLPRKELHSQIGDFAGYGFGPDFGDAEWSDTQFLRIRRSTDAGLRMFYFTREMEGVPGAYSWSFLRPTSTITLASGATMALLPDDFGGLETKVIPASTSGESEFGIPVVGVGEMYTARAASPNRVGRPQMAAIEPMRGVSPEESSRYTLQIDPTSDADYTLQIWYFLLPDALTTIRPWVYGGAAHAETIKAACRAAYERDYDGGGNGAEWQRFVEQLRASIAYDRRLKPLTIGRNRDMSDGYEFPWNQHDHDANETMPFLVNGISYTGTG